jgi:hypothetical protein
VHFLTSVTIDLLFPGVPLNVVFLGLAALPETVDKPQAFKDTLGAMKSGLDTMHCVLNDFLDFQKISEGVCCDYAI